MMNKETNHDSVDIVKEVERHSLELKRMVALALIDRVMQKLEQGDLARFTELCESGAPVSFCAESLLVSYNYRMYLEGAAEDDALKAIYGDNYKREYGIR